MIGSAGKSTRTRRITVEAVDAGQPEVEQHEVERAVRDARQRVLAAQHRRDGVVLRLERDAQRPQHGRLVVDEQDQRALHAATGSSTMNVAPPPGVGSTRMLAAVRLDEAAADGEPETRACAVIVARAQAVVRLEDAPALGLGHARGRDRRR